MEKLTTSKESLLKLKNSKKMNLDSKKQHVPDAILEADFRDSLQNIISENDKRISKLAKSRNYDQCLRSLKQLQQQIKGTNFSSNKKSYYLVLSACYYNIAMANQNLDRNSETARYMQKSLKKFELLQGYIISRQENVAYSVDLVRSQLQFCAVLSNEGKHDEAIVYAENSLQKITEAFRILLAMCQEHTRHAEEPETLSNSTDSHWKIEKINFKKIVTEEAEKYLKQLTLLPLPHKLVAENKGYFQHIMQKIYLWQSNQDNNEKKLRKELNITSRNSSARNILGVKKKTQSNNEFHIGSLMNLNFKSMDNNLNSDTFDLLSINRIMLMAFYASVSYFTIATEIRFSQFNLNLNSLKITEKYARLHHDERILKCKVLHLKAIEISGKYLPPDNDYITHLLNSFIKNYKSIMDEINQESEQPSMRSIKREEPVERKSSQYRSRPQRHKEQKQTGNKGVDRKSYSRKKRVLSGEKSLTKRRERVNSTSRRKEQ